MIYSRVRENIENSNLLSLREKKSGKLLGIGFSEEGLGMIANKIGKIPYYNNGYFASNGKAVIKMGDLSKSSKVEVGKFIPTDHGNTYLFKCELLWIKQAQMLLKTKH